MTHAHRSPTTDTYYGLVLQYRIEQRRDANGRPHDTLILSYRGSDDKALWYEHPPRRVEHWLQYVAEYTKDDVNHNTTTLLEYIPLKIMQDFCNRFAGINPKEPVKKTEKATQEHEKQLANNRRRRKELDLPLAVLLLADLDMVDSSNVSKTTKDDRVKALQLLLEHEGSTPWPLVTVDKCSTWLPGLSPHNQHACVREMKRVLNWQKSLGLEVDDDWWGDVTLENPPQHEPKLLIAMHNEHRIFETVQCGAIIRACRACLQTRKCAEVGMAVLLMITVALTVEEICALTFGDVVQLRDYIRRHAVHIHAAHSKDATKQNYRTVEYGKSYKDRYLPLAYVVSDYLQKYGERATTYANVPGKKRPQVAQLPLIPSVNNIERKMSPDVLRQAINDFLMPMMPERAVPREDVPLLSATKLLINTALQRMQDGMEEEEIRRMRGMAPQLVSARHYNDFRNESELNKLGAIQDRWIAAACPEVQREQLAAHFASTQAGVWTTDTPGTCTMLDAIIRVKACSDEDIPDGGVVLQIGSLHGVYGRVDYNSPKN